MPSEPSSDDGEDAAEPAAVLALAELAEAARRARDCSLEEAEARCYEAITPIVWLYRDGARVAACRCADSSLADALELVLNAVPTFGADAVELAFEGPSYPGPEELSANAIHVVRREHGGRWYAGCLPYVVEWPDVSGRAARTDWSDKRLPSVFSSGAEGDELELQGVVAAALEEALARPPLLTEELLAQLQEELDLDGPAARHQADLDVTDTLLAVGRGRWSIHLEEERPASTG